MTKHPLTDEILDQFGMPDDLWSKGERIFFDDDMRAAADWQLEQVMKWLDENISHYGDADYLGDCEHINDLEGHLKKAMRPTQEEQLND